MESSVILKHYGRLYNPSNWGYSESTSNYSIMALSKLDSIDSAGIGQININFEKKPIEGEFYSYVNDTYKSMQKDSSFELVSSGGVMVGTMDAVEYIYTSTGLKKVAKLMSCYTAHQSTSLKTICMFLIICYPIFKLHNFF